METAELLAIVDNYGYIALFFVLWLGFFGLPVPNEVIVMSSGLVAFKSYLLPIPAFVVTYAGVICSLTTLYLLGRFFHDTIYSRVKKLKKVESYVRQSTRLIEKHGSMALVFSYFLPGVRHFVPFLAGQSHMPYRTFALFGYSTTFVWTSALFASGYFFGQYIDEIVEFIYSYGIALFLGIFLLVVVYQKISRKRRKLRERS
ncbi:DedA family protein [Bacillus songklensis]|uniref:DedA family protein n=1 Tax=Bacillus songklensis TaxID=1069116 RepID=A0ABV8AZD6_9BACI